MLLFGSQQWHSWLCAQWLPSSTPSPIPHTHTRKPAPSAVAPSSSSPLKCGTVRHLHIHCSPCARWLSPSVSILLQILHLLVSRRPWCLPRLCFVFISSIFFFFFSFLCQHNERLVLRGTPGSNPVVLTGGCNNTTELSLLTCVLHINTSGAAVAHDCSWCSLAHY